MAPPARTSRTGKDAPPAREIETGARVFRTCDCARRTQAHEQVALMASADSRRRNKDAAGALDARLAHEASSSPLLLRARQADKGRRPCRACGLRRNDP